jgi:hypothetical protein
MMVRHVLVLVQGAALPRQEKKREKKTANVQYVQCTCVLYLARLLGLCFGRTT